MKLGIQLPTVTLTVLITITTISASAQEKDRSKARPQQPPIVSPEVGADRKVTLRLRAPNVNAVRLEAGDIPGVGRDSTFVKADDGVWSITLGPLSPGAYRYCFNVDGVRVVDPANPATSESNATTWSLVLVPGSELFDTRDVPHGAIAQVTYQSKSLTRPRRMHVYTPPGYESGNAKCPVFYLLHGASDSDASWSTVGRAGIILDNLIAAKKAQPMIVVMPAGHTVRSGTRTDRAVDPFVDDFVKDIRPYVEATYRVHSDRESRAVAGLSMGGAQTLEIAMRGLSDYGYVGVFSSGVFSLNPRGTPLPGPSWEERNKKILDDVDTKKGLKLFWFATGKDDFLIETTRKTVKLFGDHRFEVEFKETDGGHTWLKWRDYLAEFAPRLFQDAGKNIGSRTYR